MLSSFYIHSVTYRENNERKEILLKGKTDPQITPEFIAYRSNVKFSRFVVCELQSVLIFSALDSPCSFMVY